MRHIMRGLLGSTAVLWGLADEGGGGNQQQQQGNQQQGNQQQGNQQQQQQQQQGEWKAPEGLAPEFVGKDAAETLTKLFPAFKETSTRAEGLRTELATRGKAPEKPELYTYKPSDKLAPYLGDVATNPAMSAARTAAQKAGIPDKAFGEFIEGVYAPMIEQGLLPPPYDAKAEIKSFGKAFGLDDTAVSGQLAEIETFAKGFVEQLKLPDGLKKDAQASFIALTDTAGGNALISAMKARLAESGFRLSGESTGAGGALTAADLKTMSSDPRIDPANRHHADPAKKYDPALRKRYDEGYAALNSAKAG